MVDKRCTIEDFRNVAANLSSVTEIDRKAIRLIIDIVADPSILDTYELQIFSGKDWIDLLKTENLCEIIDFINQNIQFELGRSHR